MCRAYRHEWDAESIVSECWLAYLPPIQIRVAHTYPTGAHCAPRQGRQQRADFWRAAGDDHADAVVRHPIGLAPCLRVVLLPGLQLLQVCTLCVCLCVRAVDHDAL